MVGEEHGLVCRDVELDEVIKAENALHAQVERVHRERRGIGW